MPSHLPVIPLKYPASRRAEEFVITSVTNARSSGERAIPPTESRLFAIGTTPSIGIVLTVGIEAYGDAREAGATIEPTVSTPRDTMAKPTATPTAEPEDEPPGVLEE